MRKIAASTKAVLFKSRISAAPTLALIATVGVCHGAAGAYTDEQKQELWAKGQVIQARKSRDGNGVWWIRQVMAEAEKEGSGPEAVEAALKKADVDMDDLGTTQRIIGGITGALILGPVGAVIGTQLGEVGNQAVSRWRSNQRAADASKDWKNTEEDFLKFARFVAERPEYGDFGKRSGLFSTMPTDPMDTILQEDPDLATVVRLARVEDDAARNKALMDKLRESLVAADSDTRASVAELNEAMAALGAEDAALGARVGDIEAMLRSDQERARDSEMRRIRMEGLRGAAYTIGTIIGWTDPDLGRQVNTVAGAAFGVFDAVDGLNKAMAIADGLTGFAAAAFTGNVLAAVMPVFNLFVDTGPTMDQQILTSIRDLQQQVSEMHRQMHGRFDRIEQQLEALGARMQEGFDIIERGQRDMLDQLRGVRLQVDKLLVDNRSLISSLHRHNAIVEEWFNDTAITPCFSYGEVWAIEAAKFKSCRNVMAARGQGEALQVYQRKPQSARLALEQYSASPDDMTNEGLGAFRAATTLERDRLPERVVGVERWVATADSFDDFLGRWPEMAHPADLDASTEYGRSMRVKRDNLREYIEALRRDLYRFASGEGSGNAFGRTLNNRGRAAEEMFNLIRRSARLKGEEEGALIWNPLSTWRNFYSPGLIRDEDVNRIADHAVGVGGAKGVVGWDAVPLGRLAKELVKEEASTSYRSGREFVHDVVTHVADRLNRDDFDEVRHLLNLGFLEMQFEGSREYYVKGRVDADRSMARRRGPGFSYFQLRRALEEAEDEDEEPELSYGRWRLRYRGSSELSLKIVEVCDDRSRVGQFSGRSEQKFRLEIELDSSRDVRGVRDLHPFRLWFDAIDRLSHDMRDADFISRFESVCESSRRRLFEEEVAEVSSSITNAPTTWFRNGTGQSADAREWIALNDEVELEMARIRHWVGLVLRDAGLVVPAVAAILDGEMGISSPNQLLQAGRDIKLALSEGDDRWLRLEGALRDPVIVDLLRNGYGHAGLLQSKYFGIDSVVDDPELANAGFVH